MSDITGLSADERYRAELASILGLDSRCISLYWKGRVGLFALLSAMEVGPGDEVILPAFTCVVVPNAIIYRGAKPVYVDIDPHTYNASFTGIQKAVSEKTKVIMCQNTFGLSSSLQEITRLAKEIGAYTIEDCTHGFGGGFDGRPNGTLCDAGVFSTQWNKPFSTGIGGFVATKNLVLQEKLELLSKDLVEPSIREKVLLFVQLVIRNRLMNERNYWALLKLYRWLSRKNVVVGSSVGEEMTGVVMPPGYFKGISSVQSNSGRSSLRMLPEDLIKRKQTAAHYNKFLSSCSKVRVHPNLFENHSFLKYPLLVKNREKFVESAEESEISLGDWFISPLHPVESDLTPWCFDENDFPVSQYISSRIVNLPTTPASVEKVLDFLERNKNLIVDDGHSPI